MLPLAAALPREVSTTKRHRSALLAGGHFDLEVDQVEIVHKIVVGVRAQAAEPEENPVIDCPAEVARRLIV